MIAATVTIGAALLGVACYALGYVIGRYHATEQIWDHNPRQETKTP